MKISAVLLCLLAVISCHSGTRGAYRKATPGVVRKAAPLSTEIQGLIGRAEGGNASAQYDLAKKYALGDGVPKSSFMARSWFRKSAYQGHAGAQRSLGAMDPTRKEARRALEELERRVAEERRLAEEQRRAESQRWEERLVAEKQRLAEEVASVQETYEELEVAKESVTATARTGRDVPSGNLDKATSIQIEVAERDRAIDQGKDFRLSSGVGCFMHSCGKFPAHWVTCRFQYRSTATGNWVNMTMQGPICPAHSISGKVFLERECKARFNLAGGRFFGVEVEPLWLSSASQALVARAMNGDAEAQAQLGTKYLTGGGGELSVDWVKAYAWYDNAAINGFLWGAECRDGLTKMVDENPTTHWNRDLLREAKKLSRELLKQIEENKKKKAK